MNDLLANSILVICLLIVFGILMWGIITMGRGGEYNKSKSNLLMRYRIIFHQKNNYFIARLFLIEFFPMKLRQFSNAFIYLFSPNI